MNFNRPLLIVVFSLCALGTSLAQGESQRISFRILNDSSDYTSHIKNALTELKYAGESNRLFFEEVNDINEIESRLKSSSDFRMILESLSRESLNFRDLKNKEYRDSILIDRIVSSDFILDLKFNKKSVRLLLYAPSRDTSDNAVLVHPDTGFPLNELTVDLIANSLEENRLLITKGIKKMFPESNHPPIAKMEVDHKEHINDQWYYRAEGDTIYLNAENSEDWDTPRKEITFEWKQLDLQGRVNVPIDSVIQIDQTAKQQYIIASKKGDYKFSLSADDGIALSKPDTLYLRVIERPKVKFSQGMYRKKNRESFFQFIFNKRTYRQRIKDSIEIRLTDEHLYPFQIEKITVNNGLFVNRKMSSEIRALNTQAYLLRFEGKLEYRDLYHYTVFGSYKGVAAEPAIYTINRPEQEWVKLTLGTEYFAGGVPHDSIGWISPTLSAKGGIYLFQWNTPNTSLVLESGALIHTKRASKYLYSLSPKISLRMQAGSKTELAAYNIAIHLLKTTVRKDSIGGQRFYLGFSTGIYIPKVKVEVDVINLYWGLNDRKLLMSGGIRISLFDIFRKGFTKF